MCEIAALKLQPPANVADISHSEIKAIVCGPSPPYDTVPRENRYANLRANPSNLAHPSCSLCNGSTGGWHTPSTLSPPSHLLDTQFLSLRFFLFLLLGSHLSLYHSVCDAHFSSENTFFPSRRAPIARQDCDKGLTGVDG